MSYPKKNNMPAPPPEKFGWPWTVEWQRYSNVIPYDQNCPKVTIITPSYNQGEFIEETIRSILLQNYSNLEYIIIDGGSSDNSIEIIKKYEPWLTYWISESDRGQSHALNKGFNRASGEIFGWLNSDDYYFNKEAISTLIELRKKKYECVAWVGACYDIDQKGNLLRERFPRVGDTRQFGNWGEVGDAWIGQPACLFDAEIFKEIGGIDENLNFVLDVDLWMRLAEHGKFGYTNKIISYDRKYSGIKSFSDKSMQQAEHIFVNFKLGLPDVARKRMDDTILHSLDTMPYKDLVLFFLKRTGIWLWRWILFIYNNKLKFLKRKNY